MLIKNARIYTVTSAIIEDGYILIEDGKIKDFGGMNSAPKKFSGEVIDALGKTVFPGFIDAHTHIGVGEEGIGWEGRDYNEMTDPATPNMSVLDGIYPYDKSINDAMVAGITTNVVSPGSANVIGGHIVAIKTAPKKSVDDMVLKDKVAMKMALGENPKRVYGNDKKLPSTRMGSAAVLRDSLNKAKAYMESDKKGNYDGKCEALIPVLKGELMVHIHCHRSDDILTAVRIMNEFNLKYTLVHCSEGFIISDVLKKENAKIITGPFISAQSKYELKNAGEWNPAGLEKEGLKPAICTDHPVIPQRFLPTEVGLCIKSGLSFKAAVEAVTINAAVASGIEDRVGSIEKGKDADLFIINSQDPFLTYEKPEYVIIDGICTYKAQ